MEPQHDNFEGPVNSLACFDKKIWIAKGETITVHETDTKIRPFPAGLKIASLRVVGDKIIAIGEKTFKVYNSQLLCIYDHGKRSLSKIVTVLPVGDAYAVLHCHNYITVY